MQQRFIVSTNRFAHVTNYCLFSLHTSNCRVKVKLSDWLQMLQIDTHIIIQWLLCFFVPQWHKVSLRAACAFSAGTQRYVVPAGLLTVTRSMHKLTVNSQRGENEFYFLCYLHNTITIVNKIFNRLLYILIRSKGYFQLYRLLRMDYRHIFV